MGDSLFGWSPVLEAFTIACIPAACMMFGSLLMLLVSSVNPKFQATMQNLSAGIILAAVSTELFPLLDSQGGSSATSVWGLVIGFIAGMAALFGVKRFLDYAEGAEGEEEEHSLMSSEGALPGGGGDIALDARACNMEDLMGKLKRVNAVLVHLQDHLKRQVPDRFAVDRHVHEILDHLEDARRFLRGEQKFMAPEQVQILGERLRMISNQVEENGQQIEAGALNPTDMDLRITKLQQALKPLLTNKADSAGSEEETLIASGAPLPEGGAALDVRACNMEDLMGKLKRVNAVLVHLQDHLNRQVPDRFAVDRHVHEILHHLEDARRFLRGEQKLMAPEQVQMLGERLRMISNQVEENGQQIEAGGLKPNDMDLRITKLQQALKPLLSHKRGVFRRWDPPKPSPLRNVAKQEKIPWGQYVAVLVDSFVDGFLIGLAYIANPRAGLVMAGATCIEMGFLGLTFAARSKQATTRLPKFLGLVLSPPAMLCLGSFIGAELANSVTEYPAVFVGFIAFAIVALLFLVTQELLIEAFENTDSEGLWYVNIWLFIGIFIVLISEKVHS